MSVLKSSTPVEVYKVHGRSVHVKRDDLIGDNQVVPPWGKMIAVGNLLKAVDIDRPLVHLNVWGSWSGWCLSYFAREMDFEFYMAYPNQKNFSSEYLEIVESFGGKLLPLKPNMANVLFGQMKRAAEEKHYDMLPYAFGHPVYFDYIRDRIKKIMKKADKPFDNLVVSSGSGVTVSALADGFFGAGGKNLYTVCVSSEKTVQREMDKKVSKDHSIMVRKSPFPFNDRMVKYPAPFPCNELWDRKAWLWLTENIKTLKGSTLFWNLGAEYDF
jgi:hypothetical protein